jgi:hypothetical protein
MSVRPILYVADSAEVGGQIEVLAVGFQLVEVDRQVEVAFVDDDLEPSLKQAVDLQRLL